MVQPAVMNVTLTFHLKAVALMDIITTRVYVILDTLEATVILTMTTVVPLHVFMVSGGLNLGAHWPING